MTKNLQLIIYTTNGKEVKGSMEQVTEREYEVIKSAFKENLGSGGIVDFNTEEGAVIIPINNILYVEVKVT